MCNEPIENPNIGEPPAPKVAFYCSECGEPIVVGEEYYDLTDSIKVCSNCIGKYEKTAEVDE